jgi:excisionase family DNA binding protein
MTEQTYQRFLRITSDPTAAALLTLADALQRPSTAPEGPLTVKEAAQALNVSPRTVYDLVNENRLRHHRVGTGKGAIRIMRADVEACRKVSESPALRYLKAI